MVPVSLILNDLEGHVALAGLSSAVCPTFVQRFTRFQLTVCSCGPFVLAVLLVCKDDRYDYFYCCCYTLMISDEIYAVSWIKKCPQYVCSMFIVLSAAFISEEVENYNPTVSV